MTMPRYPSRQQVSREALVWVQRNRSARCRAVVTLGSVVEAWVERCRHEDGDARIIADTVDRVCGLVEWAGSARRTSDARKVVIETPDAATAFSFQRKWGPVLSKALREAPLRTPVRKVEFMVAGGPSRTPCPD